MEQSLLYFVLDERYQCEEDVFQSEFLSAYRLLKDCPHLKTEWIKVGRLGDEDFPPKTAFVFEHFEGRAFELLARNDNVRIFGPKCLLWAYTKNEELPATIYPLFNLAMKDLVITASNISESEKDRLKRLVRFMGGHFTNKLTLATTHLIVARVISEKYFDFVDRKKEVCVVKEDWIDEVWRCSLPDGADFLPATHSRFDRFVAPPLHNVIFAFTRLPQRNRALRIIAENGGIFDENLKKSKTHVLIAGEGAGDKFMSARRWNIPCVSFSWLEDSAKAGHALPFRQYVVRPSVDLCSTPTKSKNRFPSSASFFDGDSDISAIPSVYGGPSSIASTTFSKKSAFVAPSTHQVSQNVQHKQKTPLKNGANRNYCTLGEDELRDARECGKHFLDACNIYVMGFAGREEEEERVKKVLKFSGAFRYSQLMDCVTHIIVPNDYNVGDMPQVDLNVIEEKKMKVVNVQWLKDSVSKKEAAPESFYMVDGWREGVEKILERQRTPSGSKNKNSQQEASPLSRKALHLLNPVHEEEKSELPSTSKVPSTSRGVSHVSTTTGEEGLRMMYGTSFKPLCSQNIPDSCISTAATTCDLFDGWTFILDSFDAVVTATLKNEIEKASGRVVTSPMEWPILSLNLGKCHAVVPCDSKHVLTSISNAYPGFAGEIVTMFWIENCLVLEEIISPQYYHRPGVLRVQLAPRTSVTVVPKVIDLEEEAAMMKDFVITFSGYNEAEKTFLTKIATALNAKCQNLLSRKSDPRTGVMKTTHLVCDKTEGVKYEAARKWGSSQVKIVDKQFLLKFFKLTSESQSKDEDAFANVKSSVDVVNMAGSLQRAKSQVISEMFANDGGVGKRKSAGSENFDHSWNKRPKLLCDMGGTVGNDPKIPDKIPADVVRKAEPNKLAPHPRASASSDSGGFVREDVEKAEKKKFLINVTPPVKSRCCEIIARLGGISIPEWDFQVPPTHLVVESLKGTEKLLCSIAAGLMVVNMLYLEECDKQNRFIPEKEFFANHDMTEGKKELNNFWASSKRWQEKVCVGRENGVDKRTFVGVKAVFLTDAQNSRDVSNMASLAKIVKCGGAEVLNPHRIMEATHVFASHESILAGELPKYTTFEEMVRRNIHCLPKAHISDMLMLDPCPDPSLCVFKSYKKLLNKYRF